jgi:hypothetical protein
VLANPLRREKFDRTGQTSEKHDFNSLVIEELQKVAVILIGSGDWKHRDLIAGMKQGIAGQVENYLLTKRRHQDEAEKKRDAIKRIKRKDNSTNFIQTAFEAELQVALRAIEQTDEQIKLMVAMLKEIDNFEWWADKKVNGNQYPMNSHGFFTPEIRMTNFPI